LLGVTFAVLACSKRTPPNTPPVAAGPRSEVDVSAASDENAATAPVTASPLTTSAALVPYLTETVWRGKGPPPTDYSIFVVPESSPAPGYASLDRDACEAELRSRNVDFARAEDTRGVRAPVRLRGPLHGVSIHSWLPEVARAHARAELLDCRLVLSLDDFAAGMAERGIVEVRTLSAYRSRAESGCTRKYDGEQHCAALAVDVGSFKLRDGTVLDVERDFHGHVGTLTCRNGNHPTPETAAAKELWNIACEAAGRNFLVVLTPNWNSQHRNHMHLELTTHDWVLVR
jgi:hypothetical protein